MSFSFLVISFGLLLFFEDENFHERLRPDAWRLSDLFWTPLLLLAGYFLIFKRFFPLQDFKEMAALFFIPFGFGIGILRRQSLALFLSILGICFWMVQKDPLGYKLSIVYAFGAAAGILVVALIMAGFKRRLLFSDVPAAVAGVPSYYLAAGLLALAVEGVRRLAIFFV